MESQSIKDIIIDVFGENNIGESVIPSCKVLIDKDKISLTEFKCIIDDMENYFVDYMQGDDIDQGRVEHLQSAIQQLSSLQDESKLQNKTMLVCNSEIFKKEEKSPYFTCVL